MGERNTKTKAMKPARDGAPLYSAKLFDELVSLWRQDFPNDDATVVEVALRARLLADLEERALQDVLADFRVSVGDSDVLLILSRDGAPAQIRPSDIAALCGVSTGAVTGRLDRLQARGYVSRESSTDDKRTFFVTLTPQGRALGLQVRQALNARSRFLIALREFPADELLQLNMLLAKLNQRLIAG
ncbi:MAG: MarR family transcriptional regulator [Rhodobacteraceae bacterium]|nr:MarR family transcriptional regulator [Paracoccaceae bacterium]